MKDYGYGLWFLVVFNSLLFIVFAASFFHPQSKRDWRALGGFSAFVVALVHRDVRLPADDLPALRAVGRADPRRRPVAQLRPSLERPDRLEGRPARLARSTSRATLFIGGGFWLIAAGWKHLYAAQKRQAARDGRPVRADPPPAVHRASS